MRASQFLAVWAAFFVACILAEKIYLIATDADTGNLGIEEYGKGSTEGAFENTEVVHSHAIQDGTQTSSTVCPYSPHPTPTCLLQNSTGCPSGCDTSVAFEDVFTGGPGCGSGREICTCGADGMNRLRVVQLERRGNGTLCALECQNDIECFSAFYLRANGRCILGSKAACDIMTTKSIGNGRWRGGVTFFKPKRQLRVNPGEGVWPVEYFGNYKRMEWGNVTDPAWIGTAGVRTGWDWTLPSSVTPSPNGYLLLARGGRSPEQDAAQIAALETPTFKTNAAIDLWCRWKDYEPDEGQFNFTPLLENIQAAKAKGWLVGIRFITSEAERAAPLYLGNRSRNGSAGYDLTKDYTEKGSVNYDPADPTFHARYLALVDAIAQTDICQDSSVKVMYVGYASGSWGDEDIGPLIAGDDNFADTFPHVIERLNAWAAACSGNEGKMIMGGPSAHGTSLGFGMRAGFVEHYWYRLPEAASGQTINDQGYIEVNESADAFRLRLTLGDEAEEYEDNYASDYRTSRPGPRGGPEDLSAPEQGGVAKFGPLASFTYRYFMAVLRTIQMRSNKLLLNGFAILDNDHPLIPFLGLELGRNASDTPDAWCFLVETRLWATKGRPAKNWERWLYQRDAPGLTSVPDAKITQTPALPSARTWPTTEKYDYIARSAEGGKISFRLDTNFLSACTPEHDIDVTTGLDGTTGRYSPRRFRNGRPVYRSGRARIRYETVASGNQAATDILQGDGWVFVVGGQTLFGKVTNSQTPAGLTDWIVSADGGPVSIKCVKNYIVKVTFFDVVGEGSIDLTRPAGDSLGATPQQTTGDGALKTATFIVGASLGPDNDTFEVRGFDAQGQLQEIVLSFVRVIQSFS